MSQEMRLKIAIAIDEFEEAVRGDERAKRLYKDAREGGYTSTLEKAALERHLKYRTLVDLLQEATGSKVPSLEEQEEDCPTCGEPGSLVSPCRLTESTPVPVAYD